MKVITICGSLKFKDEIIKAALQLELEGNIVLTPIFPINNEEISFTEDELIILGKMHKEKIRLSDSIFVVDVFGYIGNSTEREIEFAKSLNKEILFYTDLIEKFNSNINL